MGLIRFFLACGVVLIHTGGILGYSPLGGDLAVQCFYIISGFYMALILSEKYNTKKSLYLFYTNRTLKIYPIYWIVLVIRVIWSIITLYFSYPGTLDHYSQNWPLSAGTMTFLILSNLFIVGLDWYFFLGIRPDGTLFFTKNGMGQPAKVYDMAFNFMAWTISIELIFYLFAPFIVKKSTKYIVLVLLISLLLKIYLVHINLTAPQWNYMFLPAQIMFFMAGILSYHIYIYLNRHPIKSYFLECSIFIFLCIITLLYNLFFKESYIKQSILFLSFFLCIPVVFKLTKSFKFDRRLGNLSYPIYISQIIFVKTLPAKAIPKIVDLGFTTLLCTIIFSIMLDYFIATPLENYRQRRVKLLNTV
jgi:peptidoglycan/LPS O-acetylase OafA/YrhL